MHEFVIARSQVPGHWPQVQPEVSDGVVLSGPMPLLVMPLAGPFGLALMLAVTWLTL